jgi:copper transport protein
LVHTTPEANAILERAPVQVELFFSETVEPAFSSVQVLDTNGSPVDNNDSQVDAADPTHMTISLRSLPDGVYTVSWRTLSTVDGHITSGAFPFAVGDVDAAALASAETSQRITLSPGLVLAHWLTYMGVALLTGGALFVLLVWQPAYKAVMPEATADPLPRLWSRLTSAALIVLIVAAVSAALIQAGQVVGVEIAAPWSPDLYNLLFTTRYGVLWLGNVILVLLLAGLLPTFQTKWTNWLVLGLSLLLLLLLSLGSHAAAEARPFWPVVADWLHLLGAATWIGGLFCFVAGLWVLRQLDSTRRTYLTAALIPRFSRLALASVGILALSGFYAAVLRIGSLSALINSLYGQTLLVKVFITLPMIGLGAVNLLLITGRLKSAAAVGGDSVWYHRFRRSVTTEMILGTLLLLSVGVLTLLPPPQVTATPPTLRATAVADDLDLTIDIVPGRIGLNTFTVTVQKNGHPLTDAKEVDLQFTPTAVTVAPSQTQLAAQGDGTYTIQGAYLSLPGIWQIQAVVRREHEFDAFANFNFDLNSGSTNQSSPTAWHQWAGGLLLLAALVYLFYLFRLSHSWQLAIRMAGILPALAVLWLGWVVYTQLPAATTSTDPINPVPPNADSVATGETLYQQNCFVCHGTQGKGDGPVGVTLIPPPADLTLHTVPGVHSDGQLYEWITNGFPGSVMPTFGTRLTDQERWHLVNYIRTLAAK